LSGFIEHEPSFVEDIPRYTTKDDTKPIQKPSAIVDDPPEDFIALHAYVTEVQGVITTINDVWTAAAASDLHITLAGWLTTFGFQMIRIMASNYA
jgi:hypothetical protein